MNILSFRLGKELFGIDLRFVKELNRRVDFVPVPTAESYIVGLYNMRGQIVTLLCLAQLLGYEALSVEGGSVTCVIMKQQTASRDILGFVVTSPEYVLNLNDSMCIPVPANIDEKERKLLLGVYQLEKELLRLIDARKIFFS